MKKTSSILFLLIACICFSFTTNKKLTQGKVEFSVSFDNLTPEMKEIESLLPKTMSIFFKGKHMRTEMPTSMGNTITINDDEKKEWYLLMDMMGQKFAIKRTDEEMKKDTTKSVTNLKVTYPKETKVIAGYTCQKAIISYESDGKKESVECFFTRQLPVLGFMNAGPGYDKVEGFLMEYKMTTQGLTLNLIATKVSEQNISDDLFKVPGDFKLLSDEELMKMQNNVPADR